MSHEKLLLHCLGKLALYCQFPQGDTGFLKSLGQVFGSRYTAHHW